MKSHCFKSFLGLIIIFVFPLYFSGCASFGPTKPNIPFSGNLYPSVLNELAQENPLLVQELGRLPELQDGISEEEASSLENLAGLYNSEKDSFNKTFEKMYQVGKPEVRKYCSPLQALYWLIQDNKISEAKNLIHYYSLDNLLDKAWDEAVIMSNKQLFQVIDSLIDESDKETYDKMKKFCDKQELHKYIFDDYKKKPRMFSKAGRNIIKDALNKARWEDSNTITERLNAPELLNFFINKNITYAHYIPAFHRSPRSVIKDKYGDCDDVAYLGRTILIKAGYDVFGRHLNKGQKIDHVGLGIKLPDGSYLLAVHFNRYGNHMSGPYKTLLELDQALGYGTWYQTRDPFFFNW